MAVSSTTWAETISTFTGTTVVGTVTTSSTTTGASSSVNGNTVSLTSPVVSPFGLASSSFGGLTNNSYTDVQVTTAVTAKSGYSLDTLTLTETGDYSLGALLTTGSSVTRVAAVISDCTVYISTNNSSDPLVAVTPNGASANYNLVSNAGTGNPWSLSVTLDIPSLISTYEKANSTTISGKATSLVMSYDDILYAVSESGTIASFAIKPRFVSESGTIASIAKTGIEVGATTSSVPEPSTLALLGVGFGIGLAVVAWRSRRVPVRNAA
jgi:hypothetical protein